MNRLNSSMTMYKAEILAVRAGILLFFLFVSFSASSWNRNEAHLKWKTAETEHFRFYYDAELEPAAEYAAGIAEHIYVHLMERYRITLPGKVEFVIRDDIISNGFANPYQNMVQIWISDWGIPLRSTHNWMKDVVTHEFAHLVSIQAGSKLPTSIIGLVAGYQDYFNEDVQSSMATVLPVTFQPNWFAEGVAQYESQLLGFDAWDSHRDMIMRTAALSDSLLNYGMMCTFSGKGLHWEQGPYTQGFSFVLYLAERYGDDALMKLWAENSRIHRQTLSGAMKRVLGKSGEELFQDWKNHITRHYHEQKEALGKLREGEKLSDGGFFNYYPRWDSKGENIFYISNKGQEFFRGSLYKYQLADSVEKDERQMPVSGGIRGYFDVLPDDSTFLYTSAKDKDKNGMATLDIYQRKVLKKESLFSFGKDKTEKRYTEDLNAFQAQYSPDGGRVVFARNEKSNFSLCTAPVPEGEKLDPEDVQTIWPSEEFLEGRFGFNIYSPKFSPDGKRIIFSFFDGVSRNIGVVNADGSGFEPVLERPCDDRDPEWLPGGAAFLFSSDSTGIYNVYLCSLATRAVTPVTNVSGSAFQPRVSPDGKHIAYINYDTDGFSLYLLRDWKPADAIPGTGRDLHHDTTAIEPLEFTGVREQYLGIPKRFIYQPLLIGEEITSLDKSATQGKTQWMGGLSVFGNDPVFKNEVSAAALFELGNGLDYVGAHNDLLNPDKESELFFNFWNNSLPVSVGAGLFRRNLVTFDTITDESSGTPDTSMSNHAITMKSAQLSFKYNLFQTELMGDPLKASFLSLTIGRDWSDFDFYELPFAFTFYKSLYLAPSLWYYGVAPSSKSDIAPLGMAAYAGYSFQMSDLFRGGSFRETFIFEDGVLKPVFRSFQFHEVNAGIDYGLGLPWSPYSSLRLGISAGSILHWEQVSKSSPSDTLDSYFERGLFLRGYPYLLNTENLMFRGQNTLQFSADLNQALISNIYRKYWIFFLEDIYGVLFWESGRAWNGNVYETDLFDPDYWDEAKHRHAWFQSAGWGAKVNAKIYNNFPFSIFFEAATALNRVPAYRYDRQPDGTYDPVPVLEELKTIEVFGLPTYATRISMGITFGFYNGLLGGDRGKSRMGKSAAFFGR